MHVYESIIEELPQNVYLLFLRQLLSFNLQGGK